MPSLRVLFAIGFRPFFLGAALFAAVWMPAWILLLNGRGLGSPALPGVTWHAHEMLWGYSVAVIAGFLLTAVRNWTKHPTASGYGLAALVGLWVAARGVATFGSALPFWTLPALEGVFLLGLAGAIAVPLWRAKSTRNAAFPFILVGLAGLDCALHAGRPAQTMLALDLITLVMVIIGGRVVPLFTRNALKEAGVKRSWIRDVTAISSVAAVIGLDVAANAGLPMGQLPFWAAGFAGLANVARMVGWRTWATRTTPLLWVLHLGYAWVALGLVAKGLGGLGIIAPTVGVHMLTVGGIGTLTIGMMSRVALGHTGRKLKAPQSAVISFILITLATLVRVGGALAPPAWLLTSWTVAGSLFSAAFVVFLLGYVPVLTLPRVDGKPG